MLFKGTPTYSALEIAEIFDGFGGELNAATAREYTVVYARIMDEHVETALDVMTDMVFAPTLADLDSEREVVLEEIAMIEDTPQELIHDLLTQAVFGSTRSGGRCIGSGEVISIVSRRSIAAYHRARYAADNVVVAAAGNVDHERLVDIVQRMAAKSATTRPEPAARDRRSSRRPRRGSPSSTRTPSSTTSASAAPASPAPTGGASRPPFWTAILGGSASSRLFQEIREKRGLAYSVYTFASQYADTGQIGVYVGTREENLATCLEIVAEQIEDIAGGGVARGRAAPREGEPQGPDHALDGVDVEPNDTARQVADHGLRAPVLDRILAEIEAVNVEASRQLAACAARPRAPVGRRRLGRARSASTRPSSRSVPALLEPQRREGPPVRRRREGRVAARPEARAKPGHEVTGVELGDEPKLAGNDVAVDFTALPLCAGTWKAARRAGVPWSSARPVGPDELAAFDELAREARVQCFVAPNFAIGAVLMMRFAEEAARYHARGGDRRAAPRDEDRRAVGHREGDRRAHARRRADPLGAPAWSRRTPGGLLGGQGQSLTIRHDTSPARHSSRACCWRSSKLSSIARRAHVGLDMLLG